MLRTVPVRMTWAEYATLLFHGPLARRNSSRRRKVNPATLSTSQADGWSRRRAKKAARLARIAPWMKGQVLETGAIVEALQTLLEPGDAVALEGDNQKQADFLSRRSSQVDPAKIHDLHLLI